MTKAEFIDKVASSSGLSKKDAENAVNAVIGSIEESLTRGEAVNFTGFGKFQVTERGAREGHNPHTGESMTITASKVPRFTAGSGMKKAVRVDELLGEIESNVKSSRQALQEARALRTLKPQ